MFNIFRLWDLPRLFVTTSTWIYAYAALACGGAACTGFITGYFMQKGWGRWLFYYASLTMFAVTMVCYIMLMI